MATASQCGKTCHHTYFSKNDANPLFRQGRGGRFQPIFDSNCRTPEEYIGADGRLFAITWAGPQPVSAETVVTRFFPQVHIGEPHTAHGMQVVVRSVRQPWGAEGVAYVPSLMPMDFDPNGLAP
ncbi:MAG: DUF2844 domain-containing protein [Thiomonas sp.]